MSEGVRGIVIVLSVAVISIAIVPICVFLLDVMIEWKERKGWDKTKTEKIRTILVLFFAGCYEGRIPVNEFEFEVSWGEDREKVWRLWYETKGRMKRIGYGGGWCYGWSQIPSEKLALELYCWLASHAQKPLSEQTYEFKQLNLPPQNIVFQSILDALGTGEVDIRTLATAIDLRKPIYLDDVATPLAQGTSTDTTEKYKGYVPN